MRQVKMALVHGDAGPGFASIEINLLGDDEAARRDSGLSVWIMCAVVAIPHVTWS